MTNEQIGQILKAIKDGEDKIKHYVDDSIDDLESEVEKLSSSTEQKLNASLEKLSRLETSVNAVSNAVTEIKNQIQNNVTTMLSAKLDHVLATLSAVESNSLSDLQSSITALSTKVDAKSKENFTAINDGTTNVLRDVNTISNSLHSSISSGFASTTKGLNDVQAVLSPIQSSIIKELNVVLSSLSEESSSLTSTIRTNSTKILSKVDDSHNATKQALISAIKDAKDTGLIAVSTLIEELKTITTTKIDSLDSLASKNTGTLNFVKEFIVNCSSYLSALESKITSSYEAWLRVATENATISADLNVGAAAVLEAIKELDDLKLLVANVKYLCEQATTTTYSSMQSLVGLLDKLPSVERIDSFIQKTSNLSMAADISEISANAIGIMKAVKPEKGVF